MTIYNKVKTLIQRQGFKRYATNTSWMMAEQILRIMAGLLVGIWVARYLGPEQFGLFSYVLACTAIFGGIAKLGLDGILVRELINKSVLRDAYLGTAFWLKAVGAVLVLAIIAIILPFTSNDFATNLYIFIIAGGLIFQSFEVVEFYFQSQVLAKVVSICKAIQVVLSSIIKVYLVLRQADLFWFVCVTVFDAVILSLSYYVAYSVRGNPSFLRSFDIKIAKELLKDSWPLIFSSLVVMVYMRIDQVMIKEMLGDHEVGIYAAAARLSEALYFIPAIVGASVFPALLKAKDKSVEEYNFKLLVLLRFIFMISLIGTIFFMYSSGFFIEILYGPAYFESASVLKIHMLGAIFAFTGIVASRWFIAEGLQKYTLQRTLSGALLNVVLNLWLIPLHGIEGAAIATVASQIISSYIFNCFNPQTRRIFFIQTKAFNLFNWRFR